MRRRSLPLGDRLQPQLRLSWRWREVPLAAAAVARSVYAARNEAQALVWMIVA